MLRVIFSAHSARSRDSEGLFGFEITTRNRKTMPKKKTHFDNIPGFMVNFLVNSSGMHFLVNP